jgi:hypothetical protein
MNWDSVFLTCYKMFACVFFSVGALIYLWAFGVKIGVILTGAELKARQEANSAKSASQNEKALGRH